MDFVKSVEDLKDAKGEVYATNVEVFTAPAIEFAPSDALKAAIQNGSVKTEDRVIEVPVKVDGKIEKVYRRTYTKCTASSKAGALALPAVGGDEEKLWKFVSQRADAVDYADVYAELKNVAGGPEAALKKFAKLTEGLSAEQIAAVKALAATL